MIKRILIAATSMLALQAGAAYAADEAQHIDSFENASAIEADSVDAFSNNAALGNDALGDNRGASGIVTVSNATLSATVSGNTASGNTTGDNIVSDSALSGFAGNAHIIQNTGNNVVIQDNTIINYTQINN